MQDQAIDPRLEMLKPFCFCELSDEELSEIQNPYQTARPFSIEEWTYATDHAMVIRVPKIPSAQIRDDSHPRPAPAAHSLSCWGRFDQLASGDWRSLEHLKLRMMQKRCDECRGVGQVTCEYEHVHKCPDCDGVGAYDQVNKPHIYIDGVSFCGHRLHKLSQLSQATYLVDPETSLSGASEAGGVLLVWFDGGQAVLMPMVDRD